MKTELEIARECKLERIEKIAEKIGLPSEDLENYGKYIAKVPLKLIDAEKVPKSNLILVTSISPTKAGIGKTTVSIGLSMAMNRPMAYIRGEKKAHGAGRQIEGAEFKGKRVLIIEDLISTGGSSIKAVDASFEEGAKDVEVLAIFSYGFEKAYKSFGEKNIKIDIYNHSWKFSRI